jgi:hypothetical protein
MYADPMGNATSEPSPVSRNLQPPRHGSLCYIRRRTLQRAEPGGVWVRESHTWIDDS